MIPYLYGNCQTPRSATFASQLRVENRQFHYGFLKLLAGDGSMGNPFIAYERWVGVLVRNHGLLLSEEGSVTLGLLDVIERTRRYRIRVRESLRVKMEAEVDDRPATQADRLHHPAFVVTLVLAGPGRRYLNA